MGTGVGEAALLQAIGVGAATGAATSAITGGDPLKGAMLGLWAGRLCLGLDRLWAGHLPPLPLKVRHYLVLLRLTRLLLQRNKMF